MSTASLSIGLIGNGAIAREISLFLSGHAAGGNGPGAIGHIPARIVGALALPEDGASVGTHPLTTDRAAFCAFKPDLVVECASHGALAGHGVALLEAGYPLLVASIGALCDDALYAALTAAAEKGGARLYLPAGAIGGIDALAAARLAGLDDVCLRSSKPPHAWSGTPAMEGRDPASITEAVTVFSGTAHDAARLYPKNANVAATVSLAGIGFEKTRVELLADPAVTRNTHHLTAHGAFGSLDITLSNVPSPDNPKTSRLTALSLLRMIANLCRPVVI